MKKKAPFPTKEALMEFIQGSPGRVGKCEIARAFSISAADKPKLRDMIRELERDGLIERSQGRRFAEPGSLPDVAVLEISDIDTDGDLIARPASWMHDEAPPRIIMAPERRGRPALGIGDRVLARVKKFKRDLYEARTIRVLPKKGPGRVLGVYTKTDHDGRLKSTDRRHKSEFSVAPSDTMDAVSGELVLAVVLPAKRHGLHLARITERLGPMGSSQSISLIAIHGKEIPTEFNPDAVAQAAAAGPAAMAKRADLRDIPLVTIDGADARDFDDAVFAEPDPDHPDGWHLIVAIADVSWYVRPGTALDKDAYNRGNSVYFPDRVVPMLPEALSNGWCSLVANADRPCLAVHLYIDKTGVLKSQRFERAMMRSAARLTYTQAQAARDGAPDDTTGPLMDSVISPLYSAYACLLQDRVKRGVLELDLPERRIVLNEAGQVADVALRERFDSHRLIEEFMITANVAAARALEQAGMPCMYRVHDQPNPEKLEGLREFLDSLNLKLPKGRIEPVQFNRILARAAGTPHSRLVSDVILRSQSQAVYSPENLGHFGLALRRYAHFTSPIRRYADLLVHRALVMGLGFGAGGLGKDHPDFVAMGEHISVTERRAMAAEREAVERFTAAFLARRVGETFSGRITGVTRFGLFVSLEESGGEGLVPISSLPDDYYDHDERNHQLAGRRTGRSFRLGDEVDVLLREADPITGSTVMEILGSGTKGRPASAKRGHRAATGRRAPRGKRRK